MNNILRQNHVGLRKKMMCSILERVARVIIYQPILSLVVKLSADQPNDRGFISSCMIVLATPLSRCVDFAALAPKTKRTLNFQCCMLLIRPDQHGERWGGGGVRVNQHLRDYNNLPVPNVIM